MLQHFFFQLTDEYTTNKNLVQNLWAEIEKNYSNKSRHYHNLQHLQNMYDALHPVKEKITDWDTLLFSLFYHDVIYSATRKDNEEKSAALAEKRLQEINYPPDTIKLCVQQILATKTHIISDNTDTNYFTDADLSVLGAAWPAYEQYTKAIRKEYSIYPDLLYNPGRRKVLQHFLSMPRIYKTDYFYGLYEEKAKGNMEMELKLL